MERIDEAAADLADLVLSLARKITVHDRANGVDIPSAVDTLVMRTIGGHPGISPSSVAGAVGLAPSNASAAIHRLEVKTLVERRPDPGDGRSTRLFLTDTATTALVQVRRGWADLLSPLLEEQGRTDSAIALLGRIDEGLDAALRTGAGRKDGQEAAHV